MTAEKICGDIVAIIIKSSVDFSGCDKSIHMYKTMQHMSDTFVFVGFTDNTGLALFPDITVDDRHAHPIEVVGLTYRINVIGEIIFEFDTDKAVTINNTSKDIVDIIKRTMIYGSHLILGHKPLSSSFSTAVEKVLIGWRHLNPENTKKFNMYFEVKNGEYRVSEMHNDLHVVYFRHIDSNTLIELDAGKKEDMMKSAEQFIRIAMGEDIEDEDDDE